MAEAEGTTLGGGRASQSPGNVSLDAAIAYLNDFAANAAMVEQVFVMVIVIAALMGAGMDEFANDLTVTCHPRTIIY